MRTKSIATLVSFIVCIVIISLLTSGGCGIGFGNGNSNGGGGGISGPDSVKGTITSITPISPISGITVEAMDSSTTVFPPATTDSSGFFQIQGNFTGSSLRLDFSDQSGNPVAVTSVTIFPGIQIDLGNITITNGNVSLSAGINVTFNATISENNCPANSGTIVATAGFTDVVVQILTSTTIVNRFNGTLSCTDLVVGGIVNVSGTLLMGNTVQATRIVLQ
jgi:hypothetical protein